MKSGRLIAIGDIHGNALALEAILNLIAPSQNDVIVSLGDYVNRGTESCRVIQQLLDLRSYCDLVSILGNHDELFLDCRYDLNAESRFCYMGGLSTFESYGIQATVQNVPVSHWEFLQNCQPYYVTEKYILFRDVFQLFGHFFPLKPR
jgi:serine/threonine protein phosphatase 1